MHIKLWWQHQLHANGVSLVGFDHVRVFVIHVLNLVECPVQTLFKVGTLYIVHIYVYIHVHTHY